MELILKCPRCGGELQAGHNLNPTCTGCGIVWDIQFVHEGVIKIKYKQLYWSK